MMQTATPIIRTDDYQRAKQFYTEQLGFACVEEAGEPVVGFGLFIRDQVRVFIEAWRGAEPEHDGWRAYFHVTSFDDLVAEFRAKDIPFFKEPYVTEYDMREFEVRDPDGNKLAFGADP